MDGAVDRPRTNTNRYDERGNRLSFDVDTDSDGVADSRMTYTYDEHDRLLTTEQDHDADGTADTRMTFSYDAAGNRMAAAADEDGDGANDALYACDPPCPPPHDSCVCRPVVR